MTLGGYNVQLVDRFHSILEPKLFETIMQYYWFFIFPHFQFLFPRTIVFFYHAPHYALFICFTHLATLFVEE